MRNRRGIFANWQAYVAATAALALAGCASLPPSGAPSGSAPSADASTPLTKNASDPRSRRWSDGRLPRYQTQPGLSGQALPQQTSTAPIRVGLLLPLSGPFAAYGKNMADAAALALYDAQIRRPIQLLPRDTHGTPEGAAAAAVSALSDGATVMIGPILPEGALTAARVALGARAPILLLTSDRRASEPGVFAAGHAPQAAATRIIDYAYRQGVRALVGVAPGDAAGQAALAGMQAAAAARGMKVLGTAALPPQAGADVRKATLDAALRSMGPDGALFLPFPAESLPALNRDIQTIVDGTPPILGGPDWDGADLARLPAFARSVYAGPAPSASAGFRQRYARAFGTPPVRGAALVYDLTATVAVAAQTAQGAGIGIHDLTTEGGFRGVQGPFQLTRDGAAARQYAIIGVRNNRLQVFELASEPGGS